MLFRTVRKQIYFQNLKCLNKLLFFFSFSAPAYTLCFLVCFGSVVVFSYSAVSFAFANNSSYSGPFFIPSWLHVLQTKLYSRKNTFSELSPSSGFPQSSLLLLHVNPSKAFLPTLRICKELWTPQETWES